MIVNTSFRENSPLLITENALSHCLLSRVNKTNQNIDNKIYQYSRIIFKMGIIGVSLTGNISFISLNYTFSINKYLENICAASNLTIMTLLMVWAGNSIVDEVLSYQTPEEIVLTKKELTNFQKTIVNTTTLILALISQLPYIYSAVKYNQGPYALPFGVTVAIGGAMFPMRSMQLSCEDFLNRKSANKIGPIFLKKQKEYVELILSKKDEFIQKSIHEKINFIDKLTEIRNRNNSEIKIQNYLTHVISHTNRYSASKEKSLSIKSAQFIGGVLTLMYEFGFGMCTWKQTKEEVSDSNGLAGILSILAVLSTFHIMWKSITESIEEIFTLTPNCDANKKTKNFANKLYSKKTLTSFKIFATTINALALLVSYVMFKDLFKNKNEQLSIEIVMCFSTFLLYQKATSDTLNDVLIEFKKVFGNEDEKKSIEMIRELEDLAHFLERINLEHFETFLPTLPQNMTERNSLLSISSL